MRFDKCDLKKLCGAALCAAPILIVILNEVKNLGATRRIPL
jgi:hypothetical protein